MALTKKQRFEVFKRDKFTCQYCGRSAPDVLLEVDHIHPVSKGGEDDILNLVTSCHDCNAGKSDRLLSDDAVVQKRKAQLDELQDRREQIEMLIEWQTELANTDEATLAKLADIWASMVKPFSLTASGLAELKKTYLKYGVMPVIEAMKTSVGQYLEYDNATGEPSLASVERAWSKVERICRFEALARKDPDLAERWHVVNILAKRVSYVNKQEALELVRIAHECGVEYDALRSIAAQARNWTSWRRQMEELSEE